MGSSVMLASVLPHLRVADLQIAKYANISGLAILVFDYCITFQEEVHWTWSRPWGLTRIIFTISRYLPFVGAGLTAYGALRVDGPCSTSLAENIIHTISITAAEGLLVIRTWAFWKMSKRVLIGLLTYSVVTIIAAIAVDVSQNDQMIPGGEVVRIYQHMLFQYGYQGRLHRYASLSRQEMLQWCTLSWHFSNV
ncbi:hypothetical protein EDB19DRAFT_2027476 [Suillus lakei]|nr:hypothetical protein EDB19DRAFT_2027476 [Suillus lakei]